jgi:hypothetical protein
MSRIMRTISIIGATGLTHVIQERGAARAALLTPWNRDAKTTHFVRFGRELLRKRPGVRLSRDDALTDPRRRLAAWCSFQVLAGESAADALARFNTIVATEDDAVWRIDEFGEDWTS